MNVLPLLAASAFCHGLAQAASLSAADAANAAELYRVNCAACHESETTAAPNRSALEQRTPAAIVDALENGLMREQGKVLGAAERQLIARYLGAKTATAAITRCRQSSAAAAKPIWNGWGNGLDNRRYQSQGRGGLTAANIGDLELIWAFAFPGAVRARSQPAVTQDSLFVGSQDGRVYALNLDSGCTRWAFAADSEVRNAPTLSPDGRLYFADFDANVYAVDAGSGALIWKRAVKDHPAGTVTGSVVVYRERIFVPMSSTEVVSAMSGDYSCCTFRGGVAALDARTGEIEWRMYTTAQPRENGKNRKGVPAFGPSGAPVWSAPTIDAKRGLLYVGTGENYSSPANEMSDAIVAIELATGKVRWVRQLTSQDAWNASCGQPDDANCPREAGPDFDFGAPPILVSVAGGGDVILAGQKSGMVFALDPDASGGILWQQRAGAGGFNGGVHWGMASDGDTLFVGIADTPGNAAAVGPRRPGLHAFDVATGKPLWSSIEPATCAERAFKCETALSAPVTLSGDVVFAGAHNGLLRAYSAGDGRLLWSFDTRREFETVNGVKGHGGSIDSAGPVVANMRLIVNSGYDKFGEIPGNVLLVFGRRDQR